MEIFMNDSVLLSIIIPVYNAEAYLAECLDSILAGLPERCELLLVDDGSSDHSPEICSEYAAAHPFIRVLHQKTQGPHAAREAGFLHSQGRYVAFADSDDTVDSAMYSEMLALALQSGADIVHCDFIAVMPDREKVCAVPYAPGYYDKQRLNEYVYPNMIYSGTFYSFHAAPNIWNKLFRRELLKKHISRIPHGLRNGEDLLLTYSCLLDADSVYFTNKAFYRYHSRPGSLCRTITEEKLRQLFLLLDTLEQLLDSQKYPCLTSQLHYYTVYQTLLYCLPVLQEAAHQKTGKVRTLYLETISEPHIRKSLRFVTPGDIHGIRNKLFLYGTRLHLYPLILLAVYA